MRELEVLQGRRARPLEIQLTVGYLGDVRHMLELEHGALEIGENDVQEPLVCACRLDELGKQEIVIQVVQFELLQRRLHEGLDQRHLLDLILRLGFRPYKRNKAQQSGRRLLSWGRRIWMDRREIE